MSTVMTATVADVEKANQSIATMEAAQDLINTLLDQNGGDLRKAADIMKPYDIAQRALRNLMGDLQKDPVVAFEGMKLMLDFARTAHKNVAADIQTVWALEREANTILTACITPPTKYSNNGGGLARLPFYREAIELIRGYLSQGKAFLHIDTQWYNTSSGGKVLFHEASARKRRNTSQIEVSHLHHVAAELYADSLAPAAKEAQ